MAYPQGYSLASGWNAADGSLTLVSTLLSTYTTPVMGTAKLEPKSGLINMFPIRSATLDGSERGDGMIYLKTGDGAWHFDAMPIAALQFIETTYFSSGTVTSAQLTIVTARYNISAVWCKANVWAHLPQENVDYIFDSGYALNLNWRMSDYIQLSP